jgi:hypothetical protein
MTNANNTHDRGFNIKGDVALLHDSGTVVRCCIEEILTDDTHCVWYEVSAAGGRKTVNPSQIFFSNAKAYYAAAEYWGAQVAVAECNRQLCVAERNRYVSRNEVN